MQVSMTVARGKHSGREIPIQGPKFLIGRDDKCHLRPSSRDISRHHCAIVCRNDRIFLRDYGSRTGTRLNGRMLVSGELQLQDGDLLEVGPRTFRLNLTGQSELATSPEIETDEEAALAAMIDEVLITEDEIPEPEPSPEDTLQVIEFELLEEQQPVKQPRDEDEILCSDP